MQTAGSDTCKVNRKYLHIACFQYVMYIISGVAVKFVKTLKKKKLNIMRMRMKIDSNKFFIWTIFLFVRFGNKKK